MKMRFQIALRNLLRNRRRTFLNLFMIIGGFSAIVVFRGFADDILIQLQEAAIDNQYGHLQVASNKTWALSPDDLPKDRLVKLAPELESQIKSMPEVDYVSGRIGFYGLVNGGEHSISARGIAFDPALERKMLEIMIMKQGKNLTAQSKYEIIMGAGLQRELSEKVGSSLTLMAYTYDGSVNAVDVELAGVFQMNVDEIDNTTFFVPLAVAQKLLDTNAVERVVVQLKNTPDTDRMKSQIQKMVSPDLGVRAWSELATLYRQVSKYFDVQNLVIEWIILILVFLSIVNTIGMSVAERTGEIGTLRALGDTERDIILQFLIEGTLLGLLGGALGSVIAIGVARLISALQIPMVVPNASLPIAINITLVGQAFLDAFLFTAITAILATLLPATRASRLKIVDALRRNI